MVAILSPFHINHPPVDGPEYTYVVSSCFIPYPKHYLLVGGAITILKNMSSSMGLGWHPIYEMEIKHVWNHQPVSLGGSLIWTVEEMKLCQDRPEMSVTSSVAYAVE